MHAESQYQYLSNYKQKEALVRIGFIAEGGRKCISLFCIKGSPLKGYERSRRKGE